MYYLLIWPKKLLKFRIITGSYESHDISNAIAHHSRINKTSILRRKLLARHEDKIIDSLTS